MERKKAKNVLAALKVEFELRDSLTWREEIEALDMAIEELKAQQWTTCSEGLPEMYDAGILKKIGINKESDECIITINGQIVSSRAYLRDGKWHADRIKWIEAAGIDCEVTAWMPMPEPYKEENNEQSL